MDTEEIFDVVDESGRVIGSAPRGRVHGDPSLLHRSVHVLVLNGNGELFLQKRSANKDIQPGKWDTSVGGHVGLGEEVQAAARREMEEELGIREAEISFLYSYLWRSAVESELVTSYLCRYEGPIRVLRSEIEEGLYWSLPAIEIKLGSGTFTPNFEEEYSRLKKYLQGKSGMP